MPLIAPSPVRPPREVRCDDREMGSIVSHSRIVQGKRKLALDREDRTHFEHARPMELHPVDPETRGLLEGRHGNLNKIIRQTGSHT
jgi:hypothetical protein